MNDIDRARIYAIISLALSLLAIALVLLNKAEATVQRQLAVESQRCYAEGMRACLIHGRIECRE